MPTSPNQKMKLIYLKRFLEQQTDEDNPITVNEMIAALNAVSIKAERKSIYSDIEILRRFGMDIENTNSRTYGYYLASRDFELAELKLLVDAVQSSHFITQKKSDSLIAKLSSLASKSQAAQLKRQVFVSNKPKSINESIYYSVDRIHAAINAGCKIEFKYFDYNPSKERTYRKSGSFYSETPLALCWSDDKYYLVCYNSKYDGFTNYRVDRMSEVEVSEEKADRYNRSRLNLSEHINQLFGMFTGEHVRARLRFDASLTNSVLDRFGTSVKLVAVEPADPETERFEITVDVYESPVFLSWMFQFGDKAEIMAPESLRQAMRERIKELGDRYAD